MRRPDPILAAGIAATLAGAVLAWGPPDLVVNNEGLTLAYAWWRAAGACLAVAGLLAAALRAKAAALRVLLALLALGAVAPASFLARYRLDLSFDGFTQREWVRSRQVLWGDVRQVDPQPDGIIVREATDQGSALVWIDTVGMRESDRAVLERAISRRMREAFEMPLRPAAR